MSLRVQIQDSISDAWRDVPATTRVRFLFDGRWTLGLPDTWVECAGSREGDLVDVRGEHQLSIGAIAGNMVAVSPDRLQGGDTELQRLRKREIELVQRLNEAQYAFRERGRRS